MAKSARTCNHFVALNSKPTCGVAKVGETALLAQFRASGALLLRAAE